MLDLAHIHDVHGPRARAALRPWRLGGALPRVGALAVEGRAAPVGADPCSRARRAAWIAGNALAACGLWVTTVEPPAAGGCVWLVDADAPRVLAVVAGAPALPLATSLPWSARAVLRVLGVPMLGADEASAALAAGARVLVGDAAAAPRPPTIARVTDDPTGYRVTFAALPA